MINYPTQEDVINTYIDFVTCINYKHIAIPFMGKEINSDEMLQRLVEGLMELEQTYGDKLIYKVGVDYNVVVEEIDSRHVNAKVVMIEKEKV
ncbi:hypothetical protein AXI64_gp218 [Vibrio phage qdvp001]|uniref:hypothetical protein n=1 Tax=Vibrio phage qdvp001 TaxID=1003177 RepID=UPI0007205124|nr:hypothetical protein AXI64_gp218 [Vibrio phage qdvp001]ALM62210.1 hypothetical protein qdvp001_218 [Vibrio phage qdvp001]